MVRREVKPRTTGTGVRWTAQLTRQDWAVLGLTMAFWCFDGYETFAVIITGVDSLHHLLPAAAAPAILRYFGYLLAITLAGWTVGGVVGGFIGDRLGRRATMLSAVLVYAVFTGLSALSPTWEVLATTRFLTGLGIGAEWAVGTSLLQEVWPAEARTKGAGLLQSALSVGGLIVAGLWILFSSQGISWRFIYVVGIIPAFVVIALRKVIPESKRWVNRRHRNVRALFADLLAPAYRRNLGWALLVSLGITIGWWATSSYLPSYVGSLAPTANVGFYTGLAAALYNVGEIVGCIAFGFAAEIIGRRKLTLFYFIGGLIITCVVFLLVGNVLAAVLLQLVAGYLTGGLFTWYTVHTPELFPTEVRASAIGVIFNLTRIPAVAGALVTGTLAGYLGGVGHSASVIAAVYILGIIGILALPETKGKPLPP